MTIRALTVSFQVLDDAGKTASLPLYTVFDDATATLSSIAAAVAVLAGVVDDIIDGQIIKMSYLISQDVPGSLKGEPLAGSNVQESGLFTFHVLDTVYAFGISLPSIAAAVQSQGIIPDAGDVDTFVTRVINDGTTLTLVEPISQSHLDALRKSVVTFRKHR